MSVPAHQFIIPTMGTMIDNQYILIKINNGHIISNEHKMRKKNSIKKKPEAYKRKKMSN